MKRDDLEWEQVAAVDTLDADAVLHLVLVRVFVVVTALLLEWHFDILL